MSALPAYLADEPDCNCLLFEEHLDRCPGVPAPPLPNEAPRVHSRREARPKGIGIADSPCAAPEAVTIAHTPEPVPTQQPEGEPEPEQEQGEPVPFRSHDHKRRVAAALDRYATRMARRGGR